MRKIRLQNKFGKKTIYLIYSDEIFVGTLPESVLRLFLPFRKELFEYEIDDNQFSELQIAVKKHAWSKLCGYLTVQDHSEWECVQYLKKIPTTEFLITELLKMAVKNKFIDDLRYADFFTLSMVNRGKSSRETFFKLKEKKIDESLIEKVINSNYSKDKQNEILKKNLEKALYKYRNLDAYKRREKVINFMYRKGFAISDFSHLLSELSDDEHYYY